MKIFYLISLIFLLISCSKHKTVLICGDHVCINKVEARQYFEENLTLEVKIIDKKVKESINLVELNLNDAFEGKKKISIISKESTKNDLKTLSKEEIFKIKENIKSKKKKEKIVRKIVKKQEKKKSNNIEIVENKLEKKLVNIIDVCNILEKCNIETIASYLIKQGKLKDYPDISKQ